MNVCMVGYGMMGDWHSEALQRTDAVLHTVVGRRVEAAQEFARRATATARWTARWRRRWPTPRSTSSSSARPATSTRRRRSPCLEAGKHTLIEIPIAMSAAGAERVVAAGERSGKIYGLCHPMRFRREREALLRPDAGARRRSATSPGGSSSSGS